MTRPKLLLLETIHERGLALLGERFTLVECGPHDPAGVFARAAEVEAIIVRNARVGADLMAAAPRLRVIGRHGAGFDNIDLEAATARGIPVVYTPGANTVSVAEHAIALMLCLAKKLTLADNALRREGRFAARYELIGGELEGKTLGIVGLGRIGQAIAAKCSGGLGMRVVCFDPFVLEERVAQVGAARVHSLEELVRQSDFVSVNVPLSPQTTRLIGEKEFAWFKPGAFLINVSRGGVVDEQALVRALADGRLGGAGLDVFDPEPPALDNPLFSLPNVVVTPHMAAHTAESLVRMAVTVAEEVIRVIAGERPRYLANPRALDGAAKQS